MGDLVIEALGVTLLEEGHKKIHVNRNVIDSNRKHGKNDPPVAVRVHSSRKTKTPRKVWYGHHMRIHGTTDVIYDPDNPLSCGAKLWIETDDPVAVW